MLTMRDQSAYVPFARYPLGGRAPEAREEPSTDGVPSQSESSWAMCGSAAGTVDQSAESTYPNRPRSSPLIPSS